MKRQMKANPKMPTTAMTTTGIRILGDGDGGWSGGSLPDNLVRRLKAMDFDGAANSELWSMFWKTKRIASKVRQNVRSFLYALLFYQNHMFAWSYCSAQWFFLNHPLALTTRSMTGSRSSDDWNSPTGSGGSSFVRCSSVHIVWFLIPIYSFFYVAMGIGNSSWGGNALKLSGLFPKRSKVVRITNGGISYFSIGGPILLTTISSLLLFSHVSALHHTTSTGSKLPEGACFIKY